ncbi:MAG: cyclic nucleotide-binding domain-containing protein [Pseudomonadales bacterium]
MVQLLKNDPLALIKQFTPLKQVSRKYHQQLATHLRLITVKLGETIIRKSRNTKLVHFLVKGSVEIRESFEVRYSLSHDDTRCENPLETRLQDRSSVKALEECTLLVTHTDQVDQYLTWSQDYTIFYLDEGDFSLRDDDLIDDDFQEDWDNVFIRSPLAANLSPAVIYQLMSRLEDVPVNAGDTIVKTHSPGDYFYIIKQGTVEVQTEATGPFKGESFKLGTGNYFGDEALVADTIRNATVTMTSDGILGRLDIEAFEHLIKLHLVSPLTTEINTQTKNIKVLDVRFPMEYKLGHEAESINIPISVLRKQLDKMKQSLLYVITPANDRRAELATYLMRQAGYQAYHLAVE